MDVIDRVPILFASLKISIVSAPDLPKGIRRVSPLRAGNHRRQQFRILTSELCHYGLGNRLLDRLEDVPDLGRPRRNDQVHMFWHENISPDQEPMFLSRFVELFQKDALERIVS